jgi:DNA-binding transcriptional LysR family regulator
VAGWFEQRNGIWYSQQMRYSLKDIEAFLKVAETGSISQAAARTDIANSILSKRISDLELTLGVSLITRSTRGVRLTDKGITFYERARAGIHQLDEAVEELMDRRNSLSGSGAAMVEVSSHVWSKLSCRMKTTSPIG